MDEVSRKYAIWLQNEVKWKFKVAEYGNTQNLNASTLKIVLTFRLHHVSLGAYQKTWKYYKLKALFKNFLSMTNS